MALDTESRSKTSTKVSMGPDSKQPSTDITVDGIISLDKLIKPFPRNSQVKEAKELSGYIYTRLRDHSKPLPYIDNHGLFMILIVLPTLHFTFVI